MRPSFEPVLRPASSSEERKAIFGFMLPAVIESRAACAAGGVEPRR